MALGLHMIVVPRANIRWHRSELTNFLFDMIERPSAAVAAYVPIRLCKRMYRLDNANPFEGLINMPTCFPYIFEDRKKIL